MNCPFCGEKLQVKVTQNYGTEVERVRYCPRCRKYFKTIERVENEDRVPDKNSKSKNFQLFDL